MEHAESMALASFPSAVPAPRGGTGKAAWKEVAASLLLHLFVGAAAIGAISTTPKETPPVIDLTLAEPSGEIPAGAIGPEAPRVRTTKVLATGIRPDGPAALVPALPAASPVPASPPAAAEPAPSIARNVANRPVEIPPAALSGPGASIRAPAAGIAEPVPAAPAYSVSPGIAAGSPHSVAPNARAATDEGGGGATGIPSGNTGPERPVGDFAGIRDGIQRGIVYPALARKMGWEGKVVVAFLILPDGSVRGIRVVQGSGHAVLDRGAVEAVRNASPFPRPPAEAEIVTPVVYRLTAAP